jgi:hypothetical protein
MREVGVDAGVGDKTGAGSGSARLRRRAIEIRAFFVGSPNCKDGIDGGGF